MHGEDDDYVVMKRWLMSPLHISTYMHRKMSISPFPTPFVHFHALQRGKLGWLGGERKMGGEGQLLLRERKTTIAS